MRKFDRRFAWVVLILFSTALFAGAAPSTQAEPCPNNSCTLVR
ncbi:MAG: hypothetical protein VYD64_06680 [Pseudomonadota bacterium]|nr:hypothetical protein [Pseudomonadota bacterium]